MALSRREASLTAARARRSRDHSGTVSVQYKLPSPYVLVSPSPVSREASRDLWRSIGLSTMVELKLRTSLGAHPLSANIMDDLMFMFTAKITIFSTFQTRRDIRDGCF